MCKSVLTCLFILLIQPLFSQTSSFQELLDSGKASFKAQLSSQTPDFTPALKWLTQAVAASPGDAEAHYFLGYTFDKINADDGSKMNRVSRDLTEKASAQFEKVIALQKTYTGERLALDPYSKITSIWGSLAKAYSVKGLPDSALWAFKQGKQRGGFIEPVLAYNRQLLNSCSQHAILITNGDLITFPVWYLQAVEKWRTDITPVDANLLNVNWYTRSVKQNGLKMSLSDAQIDTMNYTAWTDTQITISNPGNPSEELSWTLKPTYYDAYILTGDRMMLDIVQQNLFARDFYFGGGTDSTTNLFLTDYIINEGIADKLILLRNDTTMETTLISNNLASYSIDKLKADDIQKSPDAINMLNGFRIAFLQNVNFLYSKGKLSKAKNLYLQMKQKFSTAKLPYSSDDIADSIHRIDDVLLKHR